MFERFVERRAEEALSDTPGVLCARAKLAGVTPHVLRRTFASVAGDLGFLN